MKENEVVCKDACPGIVSGQKVLELHQIYEVEGETFFGTGYYLKGLNHTNEHGRIAYRKERFRKLDHEFAEKLLANIKADNVAQKA